MKNEIKHIIETAYTLFDNYGCLILEVRPNVEGLGIDIKQGHTKAITLTKDECVQLCIILQKIGCSPDED
jgi:hypothetical protein